MIQVDSQENLVLLTKVSNVLQPVLLSSKTYMLKVETSMGARIPFLKKAYNLKREKTNIPSCSFDSSHNFMHWGKILRRNFLSGCDQLNFLTSVCDFKLCAVAG